MKKKILALATVAALTAGGSAFAAEPQVLADSDMDTVAAGIFNNWSFIGVVNAVNNNAVSGPAVGVIATGTTSIATAVTGIANTITVTQVNAGA